MLTTLFSEYLSTGQYVDISLVCRGQVLRAHKVNTPLKAMVTTPFCCRWCFQSLFTGELLGVAGRFPFLGPQVIRVRLPRPRGRAGRSQSLRAELGDRRVPEFRFPGFLALLAFDEEDI